MLCVNWNSLSQHTYQGSLTSLAPFPTPHRSLLQWPRSNYSSPLHTPSPHPKSHLIIWPHQRQEDFHFVAFFVSVFVVVQFLVLIILSLFSQVTVLFGTLWVVFFFPVKESQLQQSSATQACNVFLAVVDRKTDNCLWTSSGLDQGLFTLSLWTPYWL